MNEIVQQGHEALHKVAQEVSATDITSEHIRVVIEKMQRVLETQYDGVALAAPQIGESLQIFVVSPKIFEKKEEHKLIYINPEIISLSTKKKWLDEGCLSCRWKLGQVERSLHATVRACDEFGNELEVKADGLLAHIFQHETDHLHGILFLEKARRLRDMTDEEIKEAQQAL